MNEQYPDSFQDYFYDLTNPTMTHRLYVDPRTLTIVALGVTVAVIIGILVVSTLKSRIN